MRKTFVFTKLGRFPQHQRIIYALWQGLKRGQEVLIFLNKNQFVSPRNSCATVILRFFFFDSRLLFLNNFRFSLLLSNSALAFAASSNFTFVASEVPLSIATGYLWSLAVAPCNPGCDVSCSSSIKIFGLLFDLSAALVFLFSSTTGWLCLKTFRVFVLVFY